MRRFEASECLLSSVRFSFICGRLSVQQYTNVYMRTIENRIAYLYSIMNNIFSGAGLVTAMCGDCIGHSST